MKRTTLVALALSMISSVAFAQSVEDKAPAKDVGTTSGTGSGAVAVSDGALALLKSSYSGNKNRKGAEMTLANGTGSLDWSPQGKHSGYCRGSHPFTYVASGPNRITLTFTTSKGAECIDPSVELIVSNDGKVLESGSGKLSLRAN